jgi:hypothetical protein
VRFRSNSHCGNHRIFFGGPCPSQCIKLNQTESNWIKLARNHQKSLMRNRGMFLMIVYLCFNAVPESRLRHAMFAPATSPECPQVRHKTAWPPSRMRKTRL